jgi:hypothetical protein
MQLEPSARISLPTDVRRGLPQFHANARGDGRSRLIFISGWFFLVMDQSALLKAAQMSKRLVIGS